MSDKILSQEEIELLLNGGSLNDDPIEETTYQDNVPPLEDLLSSIEMDTLGEIGNISFGSSATALSTLLNQKVEITTPSLSVLHRQNLEKEFQSPYVAVQVGYTIGFVGANLFVIDTRDAAIIANLMLGGDGIVDESTELDEIHLSAVQEAMNQMMGSAATSMSTIFKKKVDISPPTIGLINFQIGEGTNQVPEDEYLIKVSFRLKVGELIDSNIMQLLPFDFGKELVDELFKLNQPAEPAVETRNIPSEPIVQQQYVQHGQVEPAQTYQQPVQNERIVQHQEAFIAPANSNSLGNQMIGSSHPINNHSVQPVAFSQLQPVSISENEARNLNMLFDIPLNVTVELGRTKRSVKDILELTTGSILELDKLAGEPVEILINSKLIAKGEVVVIDENFGVRVTDIVSKSDRLNNLK